uniref:hypothetical protein n=1 Tax=Salmonella sp. s55004 TaxID=3159675 RepID=UPI00397FC049
VNRFWSTMVTGNDVLPVTGDQFYGSLEYNGYWQHYPNIDSRPVLMVHWSTVVTGNDIQTLTIIRQKILIAPSIHQSCLPN